VQIAATFLSDDMHLGKAFSILKTGRRASSKRPKKAGLAFRRG